MTGARVLLVGGIRSGKSREAERRLEASPIVTYVATGEIEGDDAEWSTRVAAHRARRPAAWRTVETLEVASVLRATGEDDPPVLVDCVNVWLARTMGVVGCWRGDDVDRSAAPRLVCAVDELVGAWQQTRGHVVAVTNEVGMSLVPTTPSGRWFAEELGDLNRRLAETADEVWQVTVGIASRLR
jgi:adenosyl cobinamide kinase/adenosyl cobinamide phosphate guanylyltransferase